METLLKKPKERHNFNLLKETFDWLKAFCEGSGRWTMSAFTDVAIVEKLDREDRATDALMSLLIRTPPDKIQEVSEKIMKINKNRGKA